jgi:hypothetical protein
MRNFIKKILLEEISKKSKELIYETELDEVGRPRIYSDEDVLERACQYSNAREFKNSEDKNYYAAALRRGLMLKIRAKCKYTALGNLYSRMLYMYIWEKNVNAVYFGLTCDEDRRYNEHTKEEQDILNKMDVGANCKTGRNSAVKDFIKKHGYHDRYIDVSNGYISAELAAYGEMCLIDHFRNDPEWKGKIEVVNKSKGGELGGRCFANARRMIQDVNLVLDNQFGTPEEFQQKYPKEFEYWSENKPRQKAFNQGMKKRFFPDAPYSKDEILSIAMNYNSEDKFREDGGNAYKAARRNKMLDILFPSNSVYYDLKNDKKYNTLKDVSDDLKVDFFDLFNDMKRGQGELDYGITLKPKNEINESILKRIIKEETEEVDQKVMNFLLRRHKIKEINIDDRIKFKEVYFKVDDDYYLGISMFDSKKRQIRLIIDMLENNNVTEPINNFSNENDPYRQKVVRTIKKFLAQIM